MAELSVLPIKIGILGCAEIARKLSRAIHLVPEDVSISAIGSRSASNAIQFAAANGFPVTAKVYGSYDAILEDPDVDAIYMPLLTSLHLKWGVLAAQKQKHLLVEKPVALHTTELDAILEACEDNGVQYMDGTMLQHHPRSAKMRDFLDDAKQFGELKSIISCFTFAASPDYLTNNIRTKPDLDGLGALGDIGWHCIRPILWAVDFELPKFAIGMPGPVLNKAGVILSCSASLHWEDGKTATLHCSFLENLTMDVTLIGTKGTLHMHDFNIPFEEGIATFSTGTELGFNDLSTGWSLKPSEHTVMADLPQECLMLKEFSRLVANIKSNGAKPVKKWATYSRKTQLTMDAIKESLYNGFQKVDIVVDFALPKFAIGMPGPVLNKAGVILSCSASLHWEDGKTATLHCSFLENLTMDVTLIGTKGTLHMHDFNIPFEEGIATFSTGTELGFNDLSTGWSLKPSEHTVMADLPQECLMLKEFSRLVANIKSNGAKPVKKWATYSRKTQLTMDAIKESLYNGFQKVDIVG